MSIIHLNRIKAAIESEFSDLIDMSDASKLSESEKMNSFFSRGLAAYSLLKHIGISKELAANSVTDGYGDNGIDAIYFDEEASNFYVVQSKWIKDGKGTPDLGSIKKFIDGFNDLLAPKFEKFNNKVHSKTADITKALYDAKTKFILVIAHTGNEYLSTHAECDFKKLCDDLRVIVISGVQD